MQDYDDDYSISDDVRNAEHSEAFSEFMYHWFVNNWGVSRGDVDLGFLQRLTPEERDLARSLLRRNLSLNYVHIIEGLALLEDTSVVPELRRMLAVETNLSRRLTVAGSLWKLAREEVFAECLRQMITSDSPGLKPAHIYQILWLEDERSLDLMTALLDDKDDFVSYLALSCLNDIEFGEFHFDELPHQAPYYKDRRNEVPFRKMMVEKILIYRDKFGKNGK